MSVRPWCDLCTLGGAETRVGGGSQSSLLWLGTSARRCSLSTAGREVLEESVREADGVAEVFELDVFVRGVCA